MADRMAFHHHLAPRGDGGEQVPALILLQPAHQLRRAAIDEAVHQAFVQASDSMSSTSRARACQWAASRTQSARAAI